MTENFDFLGEWVNKPARICAAFLAIIGAIGTATQVATQLGKPMPRWLFELSCLIISVLGYIFHDRERKSSTLVNTKGESLKINNKNQTIGFELAGLFSAVLLLADFGINFSGYSIPISYRFNSFTGGFTCMFPLDSSVESIHTPVVGVDYSVNDQIAPGFDAVQGARNFPSVNFLVAYLCCTEGIVNHSESGQT